MHMYVYIGHTGSKQLRGLGGWLISTYIVYKCHILSCFTHSNIHECMQFIRTYIICAYKCTIYEWRFCGLDPGLGPETERFRASPQPSVSSRLVMFRLSAVQSFHVHW